MRRRPHRLDEVPDVEAAAPEGAVLQDGERSEPDGERRGRGTDETCGPASRPERPLEQRPPTTPEDVLGGVRLVRRAPGRCEPLCQLRLGGDAP